MVSASNTQMPDDYEGKRCHLDLLSLSVSLSVCHCQQTNFDQLHTFSYTYRPNYRSGSKVLKVTVSWVLTSKNIAHLRSYKYNVCHCHDCVSVCVCATVCQL